MVNDRDFALMNVISVFFPPASNLLCCFHINKNVKAKCKMLVDSVEAWKLIMNAWGIVIECGSCDEFEGGLKCFESICSSWPLFVEYVNNTWVIPHKQKFVKAWGRFSHAFG